MTAVIIGNACGVMVIVKGSGIVYLNSYPEQVVAFQIAQIFLEKGMNPVILSPAMATGLGE